MPSLRSVSLGLIVAIIFWRVAARDLCGNGVIDDGEECDSADDKCCVSCRLKVCETTSPCLMPRGQCDAQTGFCRFKPLGEGDFCWRGSCLSACVEGNCIPLDHSSQFMCPVLGESEATNVYIVVQSKQSGNSILEACHQRVLNALVPKKDIHLSRITFTSTQRPFILSNSTNPSYKIGTSDTIQNEPLSLSAVGETMALINRVHSMSTPIQKAVVLLFIKLLPTHHPGEEIVLKTHLEASKKLGIEIFWITDSIDIQSADLLVSPPLNYHLRVVDSLEAAYNTSKFFVGDGTMDLKRSNSFCTNDKHCKYLDDDCNKGLCKDGRCESKPNIFYHNGQRKACLNDDKCALEAECVLKQVHGKEKGECVTKEKRDCSCLDDLDECEEGYCNPKNGKCYGKKVDCGYNNGCPPGAECDPTHPCCDSTTCKWKPVESTCAKKAGHFDNMRQEERLCVNNYCSRAHECKIFPIAENQKCFDLRPNFKCRQGSCREDGN